MATASLLLYFPLFLVLYIITKHLINKIQRLPPSPFPCLPIIGHLYLLKQPIYRTLSKISNQHGPLVLLQLGSRQVLVVSSPSLAEECFTKNDVVFANRPRLLFGKYMGYSYTSLAWSPYGDHWRNLRRIASTELLSTHRLQMLSSIRSEEVKSLVCKLFRLKNRTVDMKKMFFELTLNVMMRMIADKQYCGENVFEVEEAERFRGIHAETVRLSGVSNFGDYLPWIRSKNVEKGLTDCQRKRDDFMQNLVDEQRRKMKDGCCGERKRTLIQFLLSLQETEPECYTDEIIKGLMVVLLMAGTDTSTNTMEWGLSLLLNHLEVLKKAQTEIDEIVGHDRLINETDLSHLPYLNWIIKETMRMYPPSPMLLPHESSEECMVGGFRIPYGTMLLVNTWAIQNDPNIWDSPRKFKPERFETLEDSKERFRLMPFGHGRRSCPGEGLALRVVGLALGSLIQCFEWEKIDNKMVNMSEGTALTLPKAQSLKVVCRPRPAMLNLLYQI